MVYAGVEAAHLVYGERVGLGTHLLRAVVLVGTVYVLEEHGVAAREVEHVYAVGPHLVYDGRVIAAQLGDEAERHLVGQVVEAVGEVERCASRHVHRLPGCGVLVLGDMAYAADILFH